MLTALKCNFQFLPLGKTRGIVIIMFNNCTLPRGCAVPTTALVKNKVFLSHQTLPVWHRMLTVTAHGHCILLRYIAIWVIGVSIFALQLILLILFASGQLFIFLCTSVLYDLFA